MSQTPAISRPTPLSHNDAHVLDALFDPESSLTPGSSTPATEAPATHDGDGAFQLLQQEEARILRPLETADPSDATIRSVVAALTELIREHADHAPLYVNRAQANRMSLRDWPREAHADAAAVRSTVDAILGDLATAIRLASPAGAGAETRLSRWRRDALAAAHTHRGHLYNTLARSAGLGCLPGDLQGVEPSRLEELASFDFQMGGRYGNGVARQMAVRTNPYARMCGAIVKEALRKEMMA